MKLEIPNVLFFDSSAACKAKKERQAPKSLKFKISRKIIWFRSIFEDMKNASLLSEEKLPLV
jgi:hypothetical protein